MRTVCTALLVALACRSGGSQSPNRPPVPEQPNLPGDTTLTVERPGVSRSDVLYYRTIVGVIFDDSTSGATIRSMLRRYRAVIIGGAPGDREYFLRIPDPGPTLAAVESIVSRIQQEPGVRLARTVYRRWTPIIDDATRYLVTGRLFDSERHVPVPAAYVAMTTAGAEVRSDSVGTFRLEVAARPGCYLLRVRQIGYGGTARSIALGDDTRVDVGAVQLRPSVIPESRLLYVAKCTLPDSVPVSSPWGVDTIP